MEVRPRSVLRQHAPQGQLCVSVCGLCSADLLFADLTPANILLKVDLDTETVLVKLAVSFG